MAGQQPLKLSMIGSNPSFSTMQETKQKEWEEKYARDIGMCCVGCDCGYCNKRRKIISTLLSEDRAKTVEMIKGIDTKEHICRFNDGEQNCDCYVEAKDDIINLLNNRE